jgi:hypothetical protein
VNAGGDRAMAATVNDERLRNLVLDYFGGNAQLRLMRRARTFGAPVFVVDFDQGVRHFRTFGSVNPGDQVTEQSSMDLLYPARLVFHYERLMSVSFAMTERPVTALLLGLGGAAMLRFIRAYLPDCSPTVIEADETVIGIARRWFFLTHPVMLDSAQSFVAAATARYDVILIDLYDAAGPSETSPAFWKRALDLLAPGGCLAVNWADFATNPRVRPVAEGLAEEARAQGLAPFFVTRRGFRDNLVEYVPSAPGCGPETIIGALERFARRRRLPDRGRGILEGCIMTEGFPVLSSG